MIFFHTYILCKHTALPAIPDLPSLLTLFQHPAVYELGKLPPSPSMASSYYHQVRAPQTLSQKHIQNSALLHLHEDKLISSSTSPDPL